MAVLELAIAKLGIKEQELEQVFEQLDTDSRQLIQFEAKKYTVCISKTIKPDTFCYGVTNRCADGFYILFMEYDQIYKKLVYQDLNLLLKKFPDEFTNFYIAQTEQTRLKTGDLKGNYHVVCFRKFYKNEIDEFLKLSNVDPYFLTIPQKTAHKTHVLRFSKKYWNNFTEQKKAPKFSEIYPKKQTNKDLLISAPHYKFFKKRWKFKDPFKWDLDQEKKIEIHKYSTNSKQAKE